ncbi:MAG: M20/M25/M40 family metallo-hydrolase [Micrococcales bacterium]|nr:M20/M25/M40 family metallo-hydrolase [Micrococcales bacterium]
MVSVPDPRRVAELRGRVHDGWAALRADLEALVRIPSVSNPEFDQAQVAASAAAVARLLAGAGLDVQTLQVAGGRPAVVGRRPAAPGAPTVLLYAHHDVQPAAGGWRTDPFDPVEVDGRLYGRGTADDKAGIVVHLGALRALGLAGQPGVGVTVFVEGEEEIGSPTFGAFLAAHRDRLAADVIVVADSVNWQVGVPALTTSLRGLVDLVVEVAVAAQPVHSGMFGGPVLDAVTLLARLLATLHDERGDVAVAGLRSAPDPTVDVDPARFRADAQLLDGVPTVGSGPLAAHLWTRPALAVIGLDAPVVATSSNVVVPAAAAKLSLRVPPGQDPAAARDALVAHLHDHAPFGARVRVTDGEVGRPFVASTDSPAMRAARAAFTAAWGHPPVDVGIGASIPFVADLAEAYPDAAILVTGVEDPRSAAHGPNESVHLGELEKAVLAEALLLDLLGS